jgi:hypothetical protein
VFEPQRLLGHLASRHRSIFSQSEVLEVSGLAFLLNSNPSANVAVCDLLGVGGPLRWHTEVRVTGGAIVDLVGFAGEPPRPVAVLEAKLEHELSADQVVIQGRWQEQRYQGAELSQAACGWLIPEKRRARAEEMLAWEVAPQLAPRRLVVPTFESVQEVFARAQLSPEDRGDVDQWKDLYDYYRATCVAQFSIEETAGGWESRSAAIRQLADELTQRIQQRLHAQAGLLTPRILPWTKGSYRYVQLPPPVTGTTPGIGVFDELEGVPFALAYHSRYTKGLGEVAVRLRAAGVPVEVTAGGHHMVRLRIPVARSHYEMLADLEAQVDRVLRAAHPELFSLEAA